MKPLPGKSGPQSALCAKAWRISTYPRAVETEEATHRPQELHHQTGLHSSQHNTHLTPLNQTIWPQPFLTCYKMIVYTRNTELPNWARKPDGNFPHFSHQRCVDCLYCRFSSPRHHPPTGLIRTVYKTFAQREEHTSHYESIVTPRSNVVSRENSVDIMTDYGLDGRGLIPGRSEILGIITWIFNSMCGNTQGILITKLKKIPR